MLQRISCSIIEKPFSHENRPAPSENVCFLIYTDGKFMGRVGFNKQVSEREIISRDH